MPDGPGEERDRAADFAASPLLDDRPPVLHPEEELAHYGETRGREDQVVPGRPQVTRMAPGGRRRPRGGPGVGRRYPGRDGSAGRDPRRRCARGYAGEGCRLAQRFIEGVRLDGVHGQQVMHQRRRRVGLRRAGLEVLEQPAQPGLGLGRHGAGEEVVLVRCEVRGIDHPPRLGAVRCTSLWQDLETGDHLARRPAGRGAPRQAVAEQLDAFPLGAQQVRARHDGPGDRRKLPGSRRGSYDPARVLRRG